jgi:hypothetical protein
LLSAITTPNDSSTQIARRHRKFIGDRRRLERTRPAARNHHDRGPDWQMCPQRFPETFAHSPLHAIAHHRVAYSARHRNPQPRALRLVVETTGIQHKMGTLEARSITLEAQKFRAPMQPIDRREAQMRSHCGLARLLGRDSDRQAHAALGASALENLAPARRGHPRQESMSSNASSVMRLVGPFHCSGRFTRCLNSDRKGRLVGRVSYRPRTRNRTIPRAIEQAPSSPRKGELD